MASDYTISRRIQGAHERAAGIRSRSVDDNRRAFELLSDFEIELMISLDPEPVVLPRGLSRELRVKFESCRRFGRVGGPFSVRELQMFDREVA